MRLSDHLLCLGAMGLDTGAFTHFMYAFNAREKIYDICEALCGAGFTNSYTRVGGLMADISPLGLGMIREFLGTRPRGCWTTWSGCWAATASSSTACRAWACSGREEAINRAPAGRSRGPAASPATSAATSLTWPTRISTSRSAAPGEGDCLARYRVRMAEMWESLKIVRQAIENLPAGPINVGQDDRTVLPARRGLDDDRRADLALRAGDDQPRLHGPCEEVYVATEAPNGELGFYIVGDGSPRAYRRRCRPPSFVHFAMFPHLIRGHTLSDVVAVLGSLNIIAAELDR